ncbi:MAG: hypothetical protein RLZZ618_2213 [Pseudomonadota bacterium]
MPERVSGLGLGLVWGREQEQASVRPEQEPALARLEQERALAHLEREQAPGPTEVSMRWGCRRRNHRRRKPTDR